MELCDYIELAVIKHKTLTALATELGLERSALSLAKAHKRGIPAYAIAKLSEILEIDPKIIMAASELVTEQNEEKRGYWLPFVIKDHLTRKAASFVLILGIVTNFLTPSPAEAAPVLDCASGTICIMLSRRLFLCIAGIFKKYRIFFAICQKSTPGSLRMAA